MKDYSRPDIDCLHTTGQNFSLTKQLTICVRYLHYTFGNTVVSSYASGFSFGTLNADWTDLLEGKVRLVRRLTDSWRARSVPG